MEKLIADIYKNIGANIRRFRLIEKISQKNLATKAKLTEGYIGQIERANFNKGVTCTAVIQIAHALDVPPCLLMTKAPCQNYLECLEKITAKIIR